MTKSTNNKIIFSVSQLAKKYNNKYIIKDISLGYYYGAKIGVLGQNGAGKSSLLKIMSGLDKEYEGTLSISEGYTIGYLQQEPLLDSNKLVIEEIEEAVSEIKKIIADFNSISEQLGKPMGDDELTKLLNEQANLQEKIDHQNGWDLDSRIEMALDALRCPDGKRKISEISGGEKRRVALCRLLLTKPDILLLDEPTNHLDAETIAWLEHHLKEYEGTVIAITHDRYFLDNIAGWILELDRGQGIPFEGNYTNWLRYKHKRLEDEEKQQSSRQKLLKKELEWINLTAKGRQAKSKARVNSYEKLYSESKKKKESKIEIIIPSGPRLGSNVISVKNLSKTYNNNILFENLSFELPSGGIIGIIGANGSGKTTLFNIITSKIKPDKGEIKIGDTVKMAYYDQAREKLDENKTVWEVISNGEEYLKLGGSTIQSRAYVAKFNFPGTMQNMKIKELSGGARNRVYLAITLKAEANLLLLDEPTNDLDISTLRALEEGLLNFAGCAVIISHDRWFLDRISNYIIAFEGDSQIKFFNGNYSQYEEDLLKRRGFSSIIPTKVKYRQLTR